MKIPSLLAWLRGKKRSGEPPRPEDRLSLRLLHFIDKCFARIYHRVTVLAPARLPMTGAALLVSNHISALDPATLQAACERRVVWMMAREYYDARGATWFFKAVRAIPVARSGRDMAATRAALRALEQGEIVGVFPEGRIEIADELLPFQAGVALLAIKSGAPVFPVYIDGTQRGQEMLESCLRPNHATIAFGKAVEFDRSASDRKSLEKATDRIRMAMEELRRIVHRNRRPAPGIS